MRQARQRSVWHRRWPAWRPGAAKWLHDKQAGAGPMDERMGNSAMRRRRVPVLLLLGIALLALLQALYLGSVAGVTQRTAVARAAEIIRANMTPLAWCAYLMALLGLLAASTGRSWLWHHWNRFWMCWLWSVTAWC